MSTVTTGLSDGCIRTNTRTNVTGAFEGPAGVEEAVLGGVVGDRLIGVSSDVS